MTVSLSDLCMQRSSCGIGVARSACSARLSIGAAWVFSFLFRVLLHCTLRHFALCSLLEVKFCYANQSKRVSIALVLSPTRQPSLVYPLMQVINHLISSPHKLQIHQRSPILVEMSWRGGEVTIASKKTSGCKGMKYIYEYIYSNIKQ